MSRLFLAPRSNETAYKNYKSTIIEGRSYSEVEPFLDANEKQILSTQSIIKVWGNKESLKSRWIKMEPGDCVLFYAKGIFNYSARVILTKYDPQLGEEFWPEDKRDSKPWPCLFFLDNLKEVKIPLSVVRELAEYESGWDRVQGFMPLNERGQNAIISKFGSIEQFINQPVESINIIENILEQNKDEQVEGEFDDSLDFEELYRRAKEYKSHGPSHVVDETPRQRRVEDRAQKKRIAEIEEHSCQVCGWKLEWRNSKSKKCFRIDIDHIMEKSEGGGEEINNLWALCPNCHAEKTLGVIKIDMKNKKVKRNNIELTLHHDHHLFI